MKFSKHSHNDNFVARQPLSPALLKIDQVCEFVGLSRAMIYKCIASPEIRFPRPVKIGASSRWRRDDIRRWTRSIPNDQKLD